MRNTRKRGGGAGNDVKIRYKYLQDYVANEVDWLKEELKREMDIITYNSAEDKMADAAALETKLCALGAEQDKRIAAAFSALDAKIDKLASLLGAKETLDSVSYGVGLCPEVPYERPTGGPGSLPPQRKPMLPPPRNNLIAAPVRQLPPPQIQAAPPQMHAPRLTLKNRFSRFMGR
jgi:hypothetical protein